MSKYEWMMTQLRRPVIAIKKRITPSGRPKVVFTYSWFGDQGSVLAYTRSEARSMVKKRLGYKKRLPIGFNLVEVR